MAGVHVQLVDATGQQLVAATNSAGNFYIQRTTWNPTYPLQASISLGSEKQTMSTRISGSGACATCHVGEGDSEHMPGVYLRSP